MNGDHAICSECAYPNEKYTFDLEKYKNYFNECELKYTKITYIHHVNSLLNNFIRCKKIQPDFLSKYNLNFKFYLNMMRNGIYL